MERHVGYKGGSVNINEIPLSADNQWFDISINNISYRIGLLWRDPCWILDLQDINGSDIITGLPLVADVNLLEQHGYLNLGFGLAVFCDDPTAGSPGQFDLGTKSHLCVLTESL